MSIKLSNIIKNQNEELNWANIFHDTIKGKLHLNELGLSPGRRAANYSMLYLMACILNDYKPKRILEFGLGGIFKIDIYLY